jgi:hypothetical protein
MGASSVALKFGSMVFRVLQFCAAIAILGIFSYFLVYLQKHNLEILTWVRAVEGIAGVAALYTIVAFFLVCCLGGLPLFAFIGIVLDLVFACAFIALAVLTDGGNTNCDALQSGASGIYNDSKTVVDVDADTAQRICNMFKATFVISIIGLVLFLLSAIFQFFIGRAHQRDKRNEFAGAGSGRRQFWRRNRRREMEHGAIPTY